MSPIQNSHLNTKKKKSSNKIAYKQDSMRQTNSGFQVQQNSRNSRSKMSDKNYNSSFVNAGAQSRVSSNNSKALNASGPMLKNSSNT